MNVTHKFKADFIRVTSYYLLPPEELALAKAAVTPETIADATICFRSMAEHIDENEKWGVVSPKG